MFDITFTVTVKGKLFIKHSCNLLMKILHFVVYCPQYQFCTVVTLYLALRSKIHSLLK